MKMDIFSRAEALRGMSADEKLAMVANKKISQPLTELNKPITDETIQSLQNACKIAKSLRDSVRKIAEKKRSEKQ
jgi:hypothetical protein